jgi:O-antigen ligase
MELRSLRSRAVAHANVSMGVTTLSIGAGLFAGAMVVRSNSVTSGPLLALLAIAGALILLSIPPMAVFLGWLALAPLLQNSAGETAVGNPLHFALYLAPPLVFLLWMLTTSSRARLSFLDFMPLAFFLFLLGSMILTSDVTVSAIRGLYQGTAIGIIVYYLAAFGRLRSDVRVRVVAVLLTLAAIQAFMGIVDGLTGWNLWHDTVWQGSEFGSRRAVATLASPNILGAFIGMGVVLAIALLVWGGPRQLRRLAMVTIVLGFPGIYFTLTRGPILATVVVGFLVLLTRPGSRVLAVASLLLATAILGSTWGRLSNSTIYRERAAKANTVEIRVELQRISLQLAQQRPIFGWGYDSFDRVKYGGTVGSANLSRSDVLSSTSHNSFLTVLVEHGFGGLGLLLLPWLVIGRRAFRDMVRYPDARWFLVGALGAVAVNVISASTYDWRFFSFVPALTWLFFGLVRRDQLALRE